MYNNQIYEAQEQALLPLFPPPPLHLWRACSQARSEWSVMISFRGSLVGPVCHSWPWPFFCEPWPFSPATFIGIHSQTGLLPCSQNASLPSQTPLHWWYPNITSPEISNRLVQWEVALRKYPGNFHSCSLQRNDWEKIENRKKKTVLEAFQFADTLSNLHLYIPCKFYPFWL